MVAIWLRIAAHRGGIVTKFQNLAELGVELKNAPEIEILEKL
jgi:hypothetical protein